MANKAQRAAADIVVEQIKLGKAPRGADPIDVLLAEVARTQNAVEFWDEIVAELQADDIARLDTDYKGITRPSLEGAKVEHWQNERDRLISICNIVVRAGIAERAVKLQEQQVALLSAILISVLSNPDLGLTHEQQSMARRIMAVQLREIEAADAA